MTEFRRLLLASWLWAIAGLALPVLAPAFNGLRPAGLPLGYWYAAQGAPLVLALVAIWLVPAGKPSEAANGRWHETAGAALIWLPAVLVIGVTGAIVAGGHDALAYILGMAGGLLLWSAVLAPAMAGGGEAETGSGSAGGIPAFLARRYQSRTVGVLASGVMITALLVALAAEMTVAARAVAGVGAAWAPSAAVAFALSVQLVMAARARQRPEFAGTALACLVFAVLLVVLLAFSLRDGPGALVSIPAMDDIASLERGLLERRLADPATFKPFAVPFLRTDVLNFVGLTVCLCLGLAVLALPGEPKRGEPRPSAAAVRRGSILVVAAVVLLLAPVAAAARRSLLVWFSAGVRAGSLSDWTRPYRSDGLLEICGQTSGDGAALAKACGKGVGRDGFLRWHDLSFSADALVFAGLDASAAWLVIAMLGAIVLLLSFQSLRRIARFADGQLFSDASSTGELRTVGTTVVVLLVAILIAAARPADSAILLVWSASLAAAGLAPALITALVAHQPGRATAMIAIPAGALVTAAMILSARYMPIETFNWTGWVSNAAPAAQRKLAALLDMVAVAAPGAGRDAILHQAEKLARDNLAVLGLKPLACGLLGIGLGALIMAAGSLLAGLARGVPGTGTRPG